MIGIYKITNPNGKIYIGQSINIERRWKKYKDWINHNQPKIFRSIKKHGIENHKFEIIEECDIFILDERELYWKQYYLDILGWNNMLFCQLNDGNGGFRSEETKRKISESNKGRIFSEESKLKMKISRNKRNISKETGQKISQSKKGIRIDSIFTPERNNKLKKPVVQFDLKGFLVAEYPSYIEAKEITGIKMTEALRGKCKTAGGFIWMKKEDLNENNYSFEHKKLKINGL
jgi:group I intron endonuclease